MIYLTEIETLLITCLPALTSIVSIVSAVVTLIKSLNKLKDNEELKQERDALAEQNKKIIDECKAMRKQIALYIAILLRYIRMTPLIFLAMTLLIRTSSSKRRLM